MRMDANTGRGAAALLAKPRVLASMALLAALSIVFGKLLAFNLTIIIRISFENLPVLIAGILLGPFLGALVAVVADLVGCLLVGYAINPIITLGAACIGAVSGLVYRRMSGDKPRIRLAVTVGAAHLIGSVLIKSAGMYVYYHPALPLLLARIPTYIIIGLAEYCIIRLLLTNGAFMRQIGELKR